MAGISDAAIGKLNSENKFNGGAELEEDYGVNLYSTFYRRYDPQIGRFSGVDILSERSISVSNYQFALNDPISLNDPTGSKETKTQGGGGESGYSSEWEDLYNELYYGGRYGGKWLPDQNASGGGGSFIFFSSDADAIMNGSMDMDHSHSWGDDGFASSFQDAQKSYYKNGGTDADVALLAPNINIHGIYKNNNLFITDQADFDRQLARNAGMPTYESDINNPREENNDWEHLSESVVIAADSHGTLMNLANVLSKDAGRALKGLTRTGTVVGAIAGGIPASMNLIHSFENGEIGSLHDWASFGLAALGVVSEFTGLGEAYDGSVGLIISGGSLIYDAYDAATSE